MSEAKRRTPKAESPNFELSAFFDCPALGVFLLLFGIYVLTTGGHQYAVDEEQMFAATESLALHGSFALNAGGGTPVFSTYGPAQSVAALPFYWIGRAWAMFWPAEAYPWVVRLAVSWFNPLVTAGVAALVVVAASKLGYGRRAAVGAAFIYGLGTMAWPHSKTFFAEPLTALMLFGAFTLLVEARSQKSEVRISGARLLASGILAGIAPAIKIQAGIALPLLGLFVLAGDLTPWRWKRLFAWSAGALVPLLLLAFYQWALFGSPLRSGYGDVESGFTTPFWVGFGGQVWSFGRGIIWYAPPLVLAPLGMWRMWRRHATVALLCGGMFLAHVLFYATWWAWDGAGAWGPRFLNVALPFLVLPLAAVVDGGRWTVGRPTVHRPPSTVHRLLRFFFPILLLITIPVQIAGLSINLNSYFSMTRGTDVSVWRPQDSAITVHWALLANRVRGVYERFVAPNSVVLQSGFSYSEGAPIPDARWGEQLGVREQLPRWTSDRAIIAVRPPNAATELRFNLNGCDAPVYVGVRLLVDGREVAPEHASCPARTYSLILPPNASSIEIRATGWNPVSFGGDRNETLGVRLEALRANSGNMPLVVRGETVPIPPMPNEPVATKYWMLDHRYNHWDFWWWYLAHNRYPPETDLVFGMLWLAVGLGCVVSGGVVLHRCKAFPNPPFAA